MDSRRTTLRAFWMAIARLQTTGACAGLPDRHRWHVVDAVERCSTTLARQRSSAMLSGLPSAGKRRLSAPFSLCGQTEGPRRISLLRLAASAAGSRSWIRRSRRWIDRSEILMAEIFSTKRRSRPDDFRFRMGGWRKIDARLRPASAALGASPRREPKHLSRRSKPEQLDRPFRSRRKYQTDTHDAREGGAFAHRRMRLLPSRTLPRRSRGRRPLRRTANIWS